MNLLVIFGLIVAFTFVDSKKNDEKSSKGQRAIRNILPFPNS